MRHREPAAVGQHYGDRFGERPQRADRHAVRAEVPAEHRVRIVVLAGDHALDLAQGYAARARSGFSR
jgi:hypothetical protein